MTKGDDGVNGTVNDCHRQKVLHGASDSGNNFMGNEVRAFESNMDDIGRHRASLLSSSISANFSPPLHDLDSSSDEGGRSMRTSVGQRHCRSDGAHGDNDHAYGDDDGYDDDDSPSDRGIQTPATMIIRTNSAVNGCNIISTAPSTSNTYRNFVVMSILFGAVHGAGLSCLSLATARFGKIGAWQSGLLYLSYTCTAVTGLSVYAVKRLGSKHALLLGMILFDLYVACFWIIATSASPVIANTTTNELSMVGGANSTANDATVESASNSSAQYYEWQEITALLGAIVGGIGAGFLWTAQGVYFSQAAEVYALQEKQLQQIQSTENEEEEKFHYEQKEVEEEQSPLEQVRGPSTESSGIFESSNATFAGTFAFLLLAEETILEVVSTVLIRWLQISWKLVFALYAAVAFISTLGLTTIHNYRSTTSYQNQRDEQSPSSAGTTYKAADRHWYDTLASVLQLLIHDPKMKYMIGFNAAFGFAGAFLNSFVSGEALPVALRDNQSSYVGLFVASHGIVAAIASLVFGKVTATSSSSRHFFAVGKGAILVLGAISFAFVAVPFIVQPDLEAWNWRLLLLVYSAEGIGRATFEGTLKAVFADFFPYDKESAFANIIFQNGLISSIAYVLSFQLVCPKATTSTKYCIQYQDGTFHNILAYASLVVITSVASVFGFWRASYLFEHGQGNERLLRYRQKQEQKHPDKLLDIVVSQVYESVETELIEISSEQKRRNIPEIT